MSQPLFITRAVSIVLFFIFYFFDSPDFIDVINLNLNPLRFPLMIIIYLLTEFISLV